jgi:hypothetical protein
MHIYAPEVKGYRPTEFQLDSNPNIRILSTSFPRAVTLDLPAIKERVPVYSGRVRITKDVIVSTEETLRKAATIGLTGIFVYQACDDRICYLETKVPVKFTLEVLNQDIPRVPENLRRR